MYTKSFFFWGAGYRPPPDTPRAGGYGLGPWPRAHTPPFHVFTHPHKSFSLSHKIFTPNPTIRQSKHEKNTPNLPPRPPPPHQASPPHEMRPNGRISGGVGGLRPPTKKTKALSFFATSAAHFGKWAAVATVPACTDVFLGQAADFSHVMVYQISHCKRDDKPDDEDVFIHSEPHGEWRIYHGMWTIYKCGQYI